MRRYILLVTGTDGRVMPASRLRRYGKEAPVVMLDSDSLSLYTPIRWQRYGGRLH